MPARHRVPALISAAAAATLLLGGCASKGTLAGAGASADTGTSAAPTTSGAAPSTAATTDDTATTDPATTTKPPTKTTTSGSIDDPLGPVLSMVSDAGCKESLTALDNLLKLQNDPAKMLGQMPAAIAQMHDGAKKTKKAGAQTAINKMADDLQGLTTGKGDPTSLKTDGAAVGMACVS